MAVRGTTAFVAREVPVSAILDALEGAGRGVPGLLLVGAEAGVGKTRLVQRGAQLARAAGATAVVVPCVDLGEVGLPYLPFAEALEVLVTECAEAVAPVLEARPALGRLLPGGSRDARVGEDAMRWQLFDGIAAVLGAVGRPGQPLLLVIEDLHWADSSTREVLRFLASRLTDQPLLMVATYRSDEVTGPHPLRPLLAELWRNPRVGRVDLQPFDADELRQFAAVVQGSPVADDVLRGVMARSEGNAYFALELLEAGGRELPWSLAEVLHTRLDRLEPAVHRLAQVAAAGGRLVHEPLLRAVWARTEPAGTFDSVLHQVVAAQVLQTDGDALAFRHALLAEVVEAELLAGERLALHRGYLTALQADPSLGSAAALAAHARLAEDLPTALRATQAAADEAAALLAPAEELEQLEELLRLAELLPDAGVDRGVVAERAASAARRGGDWDRSIALGELAVQLAAGDPTRQSFLRSQLVRALIAADHPSAIDVARSALHDLPADAPDEDRAWVLAIHARTAVNVDLPAEARASATEALRLAAAVGLPAVEADALSTLAVTEELDADRAVALLRTAIDKAVDAGDLITEQRCASNLAVTLIAAGRLDEGAHELEAGLARADETGLGWSDFGIVQRWIARVVRFERGDLTAPGRADAPTWRDARELLAADLARAAARGEPDVLERAASLEPFAEGEFVMAMSAAGPTADALTWAGRAEEAVGVVEQAIEQTVRAKGEYFVDRIWLAALALAALAESSQASRLAGTDATALVSKGDALLQGARDSARLGVTRSGPLGPEERAWLARAIAEHSRLTASVTPAGDPALWQVATEAFGFGYLYEEARSRWRWAGALLAAGDRHGATRELREATARAEAMGAAPLLEACHDLARRGRLDVPGAGRPAGDLLTVREAEVLALVAEGLSNRQIGERLFISGKTVSVHVSNLLAKLGASGRAEAVAIAHRRGLLGTVQAR